MRRIVCLGFFLSTAALSLLLGCGQKSTPTSDLGAQAKSTATGTTQNQPKPSNDTPQPKPQLVEIVNTQADPQLKWQPYTPGDANQTQYDAAVFEALNLIADKKYPEALTSLEAAATFRDTEFIKNEIKKLHDRLELLAAADRTVDDIKALVDQGKAAAAAALATTALLTFGGTDAAPKVVEAKQEADAIVAGDLNDNAVKFKLFSDQGQAALTAGNFRAAAGAFEQALLYGADARITDQLDALRDKLGKYDDNRQKAQALRKDPMNLPATLELLKAAKEQWDTPQIQQDIEEYTVAMQLRRARLSVAEFKVHGDVGIADAGQVLAEALLPYFKGRFDLVERLQLGQLIADLKLDSSKFSDTPADQQAVAQAAKVRFLVLGSVTRIGGITASARLVDAQTGLVIQTAKVSAGTPDELMNLLPELAKLLQMSDEQRLAYEQDQAKAASVVQPADPTQPLPPVPEPIKADDPTPPVVVVDTPIPPNQGDAKPDDFLTLQVQPPDQPPQLPPSGGAPEDNVKRKALLTALLLGDNAFFNGNYLLAMRQFQFALVLDPDNFDLRVRIDRCQALLPPPAPSPPPLDVVVFSPLPRIAVIDFVVVGNHKKAPHWLSWWTPQNLAPYLSSSFDVVPRGEVGWWMHRMGISVRDLMRDPYARMWLGRALDVRYFVLGNVVETASFDVNTYLIEAETGYLRGRGWIHANYPSELRFRLGDLAQGTLTDPNQWQRQQQQYSVYEKLIGDAKILSDGGKFDLAIGLFTKAQGMRPGGIEINIYLDKCDQLAKQHAWETARQRDLAKRQEVKQRQDELLREAERQRQLAAQALAEMNEAQRKEYEARRESERTKAHLQLVLQADRAYQAGNVPLSITFYTNALNLKQNDDVSRKLAAARTKFDQAAAQRQAELAKLQAVKLAQQRQQELAKLAIKLDAERKQKQQQAEAARKAQEVRDAKQAQFFVDQGKKQMVNRQFNAAIGNFQAAQRLQKDNATAELLTMALVAQAQASADAKGEAARKELERQLVVEKERRLKAEAETKVFQEKYNVALALAKKAAADRQYDAAILHYKEAGAFFKTDVVLTGIQQAAAAKQKQLEEEARPAQFQKLLSEGQTALTANNYAVAVDKFTQARKLMPDSVEAIAALSKAQKLRDDSAALAAKKAQDTERLKTFNRLLQDGQANLAKKQYDAAVVNLTEAVKLNPGHPEAAKALATARKLQTDAAATGTAAQAAEAKKKTEAYQKAMSDGRLALQNKQYDTAIKAFDAAQKLLPGDATSLNFLKDAQKGQLDAQAAAKQKAAEVQRDHDVQKALADGRAALGAKNLKTAADALAIAVKLAPSDANVLQFQKELQQAKAIAAAQADAAATQVRKLVTSAEQNIKTKQLDLAAKDLSAAAALAPKDQNVLRVQKLLAQARLDNANEADKAKKKAAYDQAIKQGQDLLALKKYDEAIKAFQLANTNQPGDPTAAAGMKQAQKAQTDASAAQQDAQKKADFNRLMKEGQTALAAKKYADAIKYYGDAAKLIPGDASSAAALKEATRQWEVSKLPPLPTPAQKAEYDKQMNAGAAANKLKKWDDAIKAYDAALKQVPKDAKATYQLHMAHGNQYMMLRQFPNAIREFEAALVLYPNDADATAALKKAKEAK